MNTNRTETSMRFRSCDSYIHANQKGTGSACKLELHPAHGDTAGSIFVTMAVQNSTGGIRGGIQVFPTFDWENKIVIKLDRTDLSQILQVLRGMKESVAEGKGLFHRSVRGNTIIKFSHQIEPRPGYLLSVSRKAVDGTLKSVWFIFDVDEAFSLMLTLEQAMMYICFGIPEVIERVKPQVPVMRDSQSQPVAVSIQTPTVVDPEPMLMASGDPF